MIYIKAQIGPPNIGEPEGRFTVQYFDEKGNLFTLVKEELESLKEKSQQELKKVSMQN